MFLVIDGQFLDRIPGSLENGSNLIDAASEFRQKFGVDAQQEGGFPRLEKASGSLQHRPFRAFDVTLDENFRSIMRKIEVSEESIERVSRKLYRIETRLQADIAGLRDVSRWFPLVHAESCSFDGLGRSRMVEGIAIESDQAEDEVQSVGTLHVAAHLACYGETLDVGIDRQDVGVWIEKTDTATEVSQGAPDIDESTTWMRQIPILDSLSGVRLIGIDFSRAPCCGKTGMKSSPDPDMKSVAAQGKNPMISSTKQASQARHSWECRIPAKGPVQSVKYHGSKRRNGGKDSAENRSLTLAEDFGGTKSWYVAKKSESSPSGWR